MFTHAYLGTKCLRKLLTCFKRGQICALEERGRLFHRNTTCTLHEGSYQNAPNFQTFNIFRIDKPSRLALALPLISKSQFFISTKVVTDGTRTGPTATRTGPTNGGSNFTTGEPAPGFIQQHSKLTFEHFNMDNQQFQNYTRSPVNLNSELRPL